MQAQSLRVAVGVALALLVLTLLAASPQQSVAKGSYHDYQEDEANVVVSPSLFEGLELRSLNFSRGGRSTAVAGIPSQPLVYYFGATGGGVWKTTDAGNNWRNVSDGFFGVGSIGAIAVAVSDPNVVYVGTGSACPRGNISVGDGMYRSTDAGKSWTHIGLRQSGQIGRIQVHPQNPDLVYAAALGHLFGANEERGIFRSQDGGKSWEKVLYISDQVGFVDLSMDPTNPRILYAGAWRAERKPWTLISGSEDGGLYKTTDTGDTWEKLEEGLPKGVVGRTAVAVSPANPERVWALIEAEGKKGGVYRSDDAGKSFRQMSSEAKLRQRAWYYTHIYADPRDENTVYALNTGFYKSIDGGRSFPVRITVPHGDNHDLWINPENPKNMVNANDGGANVSFDGGESWSWQMNQPTAEIYRVFVDEQWPYRVYGSQQDNSTISVPSHGQVAWNRIPPEWYAVGGCESAHIAVDRRDPDVIYATCYGGSLSRINRATGESRQILAYPQLQLGQAARDLKYRFQWNAPVRLSPHDADTLYHTSQVVHRSRDHGQSWQIISPDLTTNNRDQQGYAGGPITRDSTGIEVYNTIFAFEESTHQAGLLWAGSDDGKVHLSRNGGETWTDITPKQMPEGGTVNVIELSAHDPGRAFIAVYRYRENDFRPYILRTRNYGKSWDLLTDGNNGIPATHFTRAVREDPHRQGLLYAGTEFGLYVSFDDGEHWQRFQHNLPVSPVTDLVVHRRDLVVSTQGRAFWVLDDVSPLQQVSDKVEKSDRWLYQPRQAYRGLGSALVRFYVAAKPEAAMTLEVLDSKGEVLRSFEYKPEKEEGGEAETSEDASDEESDELEVKEGLNTFRWNLRHRPIQKSKGVVHWGGTPGLSVLPGAYQVRLSSGEWSQTRSLEVALHPSFDATQEELQEQYDMAKEVSAALEELYAGLNRLRDIKAQVTGMVTRLKKAGVEEDELKEVAKGLTDKLTEIEEQLTQVKSKSPQDPLNFPPMLDNQLAMLYTYVAAGNDRPTAGARQRFADLKPELARLMGELRQVADSDLAALNDLVKRREVPAVVVETGF